MTSRPMLHKLCMDDVSEYQKSWGPPMDSNIFACPADVRIDEPNAKQISTLGPFSDLDQRSVPNESTQNFAKPSLWKTVASERSCSSSSSMIQVQKRRHSVCFFGVEPAMPKASSTNTSPTNSPTRGKRRNSVCFGGVEERIFFKDESQASYRLPPMADNNCRAPNNIESFDGIISANQLAHQLSKKWQEAPDNWSSGHSAQPFSRTSSHQNSANTKANLRQHSHNKIMIMNQGCRSGLGMPQMRNYLRASLAPKQRGPLGRGRRAVEEGDMQAYVDRIVLHVFVVCIVSLVAALLTVEWH
mmetsp:Transcript_37176/g.76196  ORF Transcript_37176/g.76196 Transcript_37176/m.76196 type:complete len:301 (-) Transcript_37176:162-1064(-)